MNKKCLQYSVLIGLLMINTPSFSVYNAVFRGIQGVSASICIGKGLKDAYNYDKEVQIQEVLVKFEPRKSAFFVRNWAKKEIEKLKDVPEITFHSSNNWGAFKNNIYMPKSWEFVIPLLKDKIIVQNPRMALSAMSLRHEVSHVINDDVKRKTYALMWIPAAVQGVCSSASYGFNKLFNIKSPKKLVPALFRSSLAVGSIPVKITLSTLGMISSMRHYEKQADQYACENAGSRLELEEFEKFFQAHSDDFKKILKNNPKKIKCEFVG